MSAYSYKIEYKPGSQNECADCLSRLPAPYTSRSPTEKTGTILKMDVSTLPVAAADIAQATCQDKLLAVVFQKTRMGQWTRTPTEDLMPYYRRWTELSCHDGCLLWGQRVIIPRKLRGQMLRELHEGYVGICGMKALERSFI